MKERVASWWSDVQRTRSYDKFLQFCEGCAVAERMFSSVCRQMRRTGLTSFEKLTYTALLIEVLGLASFLLFG